MTIWKAFEWITASWSLWLAAWIAHPSAAFTIPPYDVLLSVAPEAVWGGLWSLIALSHMTVMVIDGRDWGWTVYVRFLAVGFHFHIVSLFTALFILGDPSSPEVLKYSIMSVMLLLTAVNITIECIRKIRPWKQ